MLCALQQGGQRPQDPPQEAAHGLPVLLQGDGAAPGQGGLEVPLHLRHGGAAVEQGRALEVVVEAAVVQIDRKSVV